MKNQIQLFRLLKFTKEAAEKKTNKELRKEGLTIAQGHIVLFLHEQSGYSATLKEIEKELQVAQSTIVLMISKMERNNFVSTHISPLDKRVKFVSLTAKGRKTKNFVVETLKKVQIEVLSTLTKEEEELFISLFAKINASLV